MFNLNRLALLTTMLISTAALALNDPTRPPKQQVERSATSAPTLQLNSLLVAPHRRLAIINNKSVSVGDSIEGARVIAITPDAVTLMRAGRTLLLTPKHISIRQTD